MALRPRLTACSMISRYGSHALAPGARSGRGYGRRLAAWVDPPWALAGLAVQESVDTPPCCGRFWRQHHLWWSPHRHAGRAQIGAGGLPPDPSLFLDPPE